MALWKNLNFYMYFSCHETSCVYWSNLQINIHIFTQSIMQKFFWLNFCDCSQNTTKWKTALCKTPVPKIILKKEKCKCGPFLNWLYLVMVTTRKCLSLAWHINPHRQVKWSISEHNITINVTACRIKEKK